MIKLSFRTKWRCICCIFLNVNKINLYSISTKYIEQAKQRIKDRDHEVPDEDKSVLEKLLAVDEKVAIMMANEMLMAGIDTVSVAI